MPNKAPSRRGSAQAQKAPPALYKELFEHSPDAIVMTNSIGSFVGANQRACALLGYTRELLLAMSWRDVLVDLAMLDQVQTGDAADIECHLRRSDGSMFEARLAVRGATSGYRFIFLRDLTTHKRDERRLRYHSYVLEHVSDAIIAADLEYTCLSWNQAAEALYGWRADEVIGRGLTDIFQTEYPGASREEILYHLYKDGHWKGEFVQRRKDGAQLIILASIALLKDSADTPLGIVLANHDITEQRRAAAAQAQMEERLRQAQKLESIGRLVGGVAHHFNNLLAVILGYSELMMYYLGDDDPLRADLLQIQQATDRAAALTRQLLAFGRKQVLTPKLLDLNKLIENMYTMLEQLIGADISFEIDLQADLWPVLADPHQIEQVIMDLVINARESMPNGGRLSIATRNMLPGEQIFARSPDAPESPSVLIALTDSGSGMAELKLDQIFEPFMTIKTPGHGTGLELASVYGIIAQSGGTIKVDSQPGFGSTFLIALPSEPRVMKR